MKFSIIIPAYNAEDTILSALQSVAQQTFPDFEVIVIDDGSSDRTGEKAQAFVRKDSRFRYIRQRNAGVSSARNRGIQEASGEFLVFLDSDDRYTDRYLEVFSEMIDNHPACDHFWCGHQTMDAQDQPIGCCCYGVDDSVHITDRNEITALHRKSLDAPLWNKAYRRSIVEQHSLTMQTGLSLGEDLLFNYAYLDAGRTSIVITSKLLYHYRRTSCDTLDSRYRDDLKDIYDMLDERLLCYLEQWKLAPDCISAFYSSVFYRMEKTLLNTYRPENTMSAAEKRQFNRRILNSRKFQFILKNMDAAIHPAYRLAYRLRSWQLVLLLNKLRDIKYGCQSAH